MKLIIFYHLKDWYNLSYPVLFNYLSIIKNKEMLTENNIELINFIDFLPDEDKEFINTSNKNNIDVDELPDYPSNGMYGKGYVSYVHKAFAKLVDIMRTSNLYDNSILIGFQNIGSDFFFYRKGHCPFDYYDVFKSKNCKFIMWMDDLHGFPDFPNIEDYDENKDYSNCKDYRLDIVDKILTPSRFYYEHLNSQYLTKTIQYFYSLNEDWYTKLDINNFNERRNKILLSGATPYASDWNINNYSPYPIRTQLRRFYEKKLFIYNLIELLEHPGYNRIKNNFFDKVGLKYLKHISMYKGAFFGYGKKPWNVNLAKIIEILMCGTIGFFEFSPLLEKELGLIAFKHYVPITDDTGNLIKDTNYYLKYLNSKEGEQIALNGANYVRTEFSSKRRINQLITIINTL
jgi:hypothetical protein